MMDSPLVTPRIAMMNSVGHATVELVFSGLLIGPRTGNLQSKQSYTLPVWSIPE